jgi:hypothetical protein
MRFAGYVGPRPLAGTVYRPGDYRKSRQTCGLSPKRSMSANTAMVPHRPRFVLKHEVPSRLAKA